MSFIPLICLFNHLLISYGLVFNYFMLWVIIQYYAIYFVAQTLAIGARSVSSLQGPCDVTCDCAYFVCCLEHLLTSWL